MKRLFAQPIPNSLLVCLLLSAPVLMTACKPRADVSATKSDQTNGSLIIDIRLVTLFDNDAHKIYDGLKWSDGYLGGGSFERTKGLEIRDFIRREQAFSANLSVTMVKFRKNEINIQAQDKRVIAFSAGKNVQEDAVRLYNLATQALQNGDSGQWGLEVVFGMRPLIQSMLPVHLRVMQEMDHWVSTAPPLKYETKPTVAATKPSVNPAAPATTAPSGPSSQPSGSTPTTATAGTKSTTPTATTASASPTPAVRASGTPEGSAVYVDPNTPLPDVTKPVVSKPVVEEQQPPQEPPPVKHVYVKPTPSPAICAHQPAPGASEEDRKLYFDSLWDSFNKLKNYQYAKESGIPSRQDYYKVVGEQYAKPLKYGFQIGQCGPRLQNPTPAIEDCFAEPIIALLSQSPEMRCIFEANSGVDEMYSLRDHTRMMMQIYANQRDFSKISGIKYHDTAIEYYFPVILALHDIGKPLAAAYGDRNQQHIYSVPIVKSVMRAMGFDVAETLLALKMIDQDYLGELVYNVNIGRLQPEVGLRTAYEAMVSTAKDLKMPLLDYTKIQALYYTADAASYPRVMQGSFYLGNGQPPCPGQGKLCTRTGVLEYLLSEAAKPVSNLSQPINVKPAGPSNSHDAGPPTPAGTVAKGTSAGSKTASSTNPTDPAIDAIAKKSAATAAANPKPAESKTVSLGDFLSSALDLGGIFKDPSKPNDSPYRSSSPVTDKEDAAQDGSD